MGISRFYAHSLEGRPEDAWQGLAEHLHGVAERAAAFAAHFGAAETAYAAGLLHDLGKYTEPFQQRLRGGQRVDHATWGARVAMERYGPLAYLLAYAIAGHHAGLANGARGERRRGLSERLDDSLPTLDARWRQELTLPEVARLRGELAALNGMPERAMFQLALRVRMLFSCLVDADYLDTEMFYRMAEGVSPPVPDIVPQQGLLELRAALDAHLASVAAGVQDTEVNRLRAEVLSHARAGAVHAPGVFTLTVPTGGGKTLASLAFALNHAIAHGLRRVIVVIPFTSVVEQTAAVYRHALGEAGARAVLEHHSAFRDAPGLEPEAKDKLARAMENWDVPIVVTTAVQFFESLFADRPSRCRKLHNISSSVIVLDEAQTMPLNLLKPSVAALDELTRNYRASVVLCTATQPALNAPAFKGGFNGVRELAPGPVRLYQALRRVTVRHVGELSDEALAGRLREAEQALLIVNNRRHARTLFQGISSEEGARHLSTFMCAAHRSAVLADVKVRLQAGLPCRLVSTSLVEAGVDVDFPRVLRAEAGLDSIAQAAGRCNREGRRCHGDSLVEVFTSQAWPAPKSLAAFANAAREVLRQGRFCEDPLTPEAIAAYFDFLYWQKGEDALDAKRLMRCLAEARPESLPFETLATEYRLIEQEQFPVIVPYSGVDVLLARLVADGPAPWRELQPYTVNLPRSAYMELDAAGALEAVLPQRYGEQFVRLANPSLYHPDFGVHWDDPGFIRVEDALW